MFNALVKRKRPEDDSGMALVVCLLIMVVMAMIGIGVTMDSTLEIKISGNYKDKAVSFQNADAGLSASPEIIEDNLDNTRSVEPYTYSDDNKVPVIKVNSKAFTNLPAYISKPLPSSPTIEFTSSAGTGVSKIPMKTGVYISKTGHFSAGSAILMAAGYEGVGKAAAAGGYVVYFRCLSQDRQGGATSRTELFYRHVPH
jgi:Tfp pilus assembly protein PilX